MTKAPRCATCGKRHQREMRCWSGRHVARTLALVLAHYGDTCCHCGLPGSRSVEHVQPRSHGGTDDLVNLLPAHLRCNQKRGTRPMLGYGIRRELTPMVSRW